jgi:hypothetical protein
MKTRNWRFILFLAAIFLVSMAFQHRAEAFAEPCPPFPFIGWETIQEGCCLQLNPLQSTKAYYTYQCVDGLAEDSSRSCSAEPCTS